MNLTEIKISNYKSICKMQSIGFSKGITTLLGKNGSGKTNILESLNLFFNLPSKSLVKGFMEPDYIAKILLDATEIKKFGLDVEYNNQTKYVEVFFNALNFNDKKITSSLLSVTLNKYKNRIKVYIGNTISDLTEIINIANESKLVKLEEECKKASDECRKFMEAFNGFFNSNLHNDTYSIVSYDKFRMELSIANTIDSAENISEAEKYKIKNDIELLLKDVYENRSKIIKILEIIESLLDKEKEDSFVSLVLKTICKNCYYLDNESGLIFGSRFFNSDFYEGNSGYSIEKIFIKYLKENNIIKENTFVSDEQNKEVIKKEFQKLLNASLPKFDNSMFKSVEADFEDGNLQLYVIENNGTKVNFNATSLGRRWYFTYFFIKNHLKKGDIFLIDEPASFLHPQTQSVILKSLEQLAERGITVIISTHSPYMISDSSNFIHVSMTENGTVVKRQDKENIELVRADMGLIPYNDLLLNLTRQIILVEGYKDVCCLQTFMRLFDIEESNYYIFHTSGAHQMPYLKKFFDDNYINYKILLDADTLEWTKDMEGVNEDERQNRNKLIDFVNTHRFDNNVIYVGENHKPKCMEGLFAEGDREKYFAISNGRHRKVSPEKLANAKSLNDFEKATVCEFEKLFVKLEIL